MRNGFLFAYRILNDTMYKMKIFLDTLQAVVEETEIEQDKILSGCKEEEVVDARALLIKLMSLQGLYPAQIGRLTGICQRSIPNYLQGFNERVKARRILGINYDKARKVLGI